MIHKIEGLVGLFLVNNIIVEFVNEQAKSHALTDDCRSLHSECKQQNLRDRDTIIIINSLQERMHDFQGYK